MRRSRRRQLILRYTFLYLFHIPRIKLNENVRTCYMWLETACEYNTQHKSLDSLYTFIMIEFSDILILKHAYTN